MIAYLQRTLASRLKHGRSLTLLAVLGVALGVASVFSIQLLNRNSLAAFSGSVQSLSGDADLSVTGRTPTLPETFYPKVLATAGVSEAWPIYRIDVAVEGHPGLFLEVAGLDLFAAGRLPLVSGDGAGDGNAHGTDALAAFLYRPGWVAVSPALAEEMGWSVGDTVTVSSGSRLADLHIGALVDFRRHTPLAPRKLAVMDIAQAQSLLGRRGELHQVDLKIDKGRDLEEMRRLLTAALGPAVQVLTPEQREQNAAGLLSAFRLNLTALSLISLFVGVFLVYGSVRATLVRRRAEFGLIRSLGGTRSQVLALILGEAGALGLLGAIIGVPLGWLAARLNMGLVSGTLTNIYLLEEIERLRVPADLVVLALLIGVGGALAGALQPSLDMARKDTRTLLSAFTLHQRADRLAPRMAFTALAVGVAALAFYGFYGRTVRWGGFSLGLMILVAFPLLTPLIIRLVCRPIRVRRLGLAYSARNLLLRLGTSSVAVAALGIAVCMLVGVTLLIGSFRATLETWIAGYVRADIYVSTKSWTRAGREAFLTPGLVEELTTLPGVRSSALLRRFPVMSGERKIMLSGISFDLENSDYILPLKSGDSREALRRVRDEDATIITEPLALKTGLGPGDTLTITGPDGEVHFTIAGVSRDYSTESGMAYFSMQTVDRFFGPGQVNSVGLYLKKGLAPDEAADGLRARYEQLPLEVRSSRDIRDGVLQLFDQTFAVTRLLQVMALLTAACGIALSLLVQARERISELALYRCLGAGRGQIFRLFLGEGLAAGLLGTLLGAAGGVLLALILIYVINPAYFGWTIQPHWPWPALLRQAAGIMAAALAASVYPALRGSRTPARELSREDL